MSGHPPDYERTDLNLGMLILFSIVCIVAVIGSIFVLDFYFDHVKNDIANNPVKTEKTVDKINKKDKEVLKNGDENNTSYEKGAESILGKEKDNKDK